MREALSTDLLLRLIHATPEQYASVERLLGIAGGENGKMEKREPASDDVARQVFALVKALESKTNFRKAPVTKVFQLYCLESLSCREVAKACRCSPGLVVSRLKVIEEKLGRKPEHIRTFSAEFERIADSLRDSRARQISRQRAILGDDPGDEE
jgi:hypothetical protein